MTTLLLPIPPSVNAAYRNVSGRGRAATEAYRQWVLEADTAFIQQKRGTVSITGPYRLAIYLPQSMRGDISNRIKVVEDYLVKRNVTPDDAHSQKVSAERSPDVPDHFCRIEVEAA